MGLFPDREPQWRPQRLRLALAGSVAVHLLAAVWLMRQHLPAPPPLHAPRVISILLQPPAHAPPVHASPRPATRAQHASTPTPAEPAPAPSIQSPPDTLATPEPGPVDAATLARDPAAAANGSFTVGMAKRQAGRIDRELRGGKSGVPLEADTPWARFQRGLEAAHVERSMSVIEDSYTSPDGVVIYRRRIGSRTICYRTGSVGLGVAGARGVNDAGPVDCPTGVTWTRE
jgi:hypothetical protein